MNLESADLIEEASLLAKKLTEGVDIYSLLASLKLPALDIFSQLASSLLPQNLTQVDGEGNFSLLGPLDLQDAIKSGVDSLQDVITQQVQGVINEVTSVVQQATDSANQVIDAVNTISTTILSDQTSFFEKAVETVSNITNLNVDTGVLSNYSGTVNKVIDQIKEFSPKQIRDLADPEFYKQVVSSTVAQASDALTKEVLSVAQQYVAPVASIGAISSLFNTANSLLQNSGPRGGSNSYSIQANISVYYGKGEGGDLDAYKKKSVSKKQLASGQSCAVDNVKILIGSKVEVPGIGTFTAVDRLRGGGYNLQLYYDSVDKGVEIQSKIVNPILVKVTPADNSLSSTPQLVSIRGNDPKLI
jgi:predicted RecB family endonuclease